MWARLDLGTGLELMLRPLDVVGREEEPVLDKK